MYIKCWCENLNSLKYLCAELFIKVRRRSNLNCFNHCELYLWKVLGTNIKIPLKASLLKKYIEKVLDLEFDSNRLAGLAH